MRGSAANQGQPPKPLTLKVFKLLAQEEAAEQEAIRGEGIYDLRCLGDRLSRASNFKLRPKFSVHTGILSG